jgi:hypothetical protein
VRRGAKKVGHHCSNQKLKPVYVTSSDKALNISHSKSILLHSHSWFDFLDGWAVVTAQYYRILYCPVA